jgi:hypothetical protein
MDAVIETLLESARRDPLPAEHASSHWQRYGADTEARLRDGRLALRAVGFDGLYPKGPLGGALSWLERRSYRRVTARLASYPRVWAAARRLADDLKVGADFSVFKSAAALSVLADHWDSHGLSPRSFVLIGDGNGFLGALIRRWIPEAVIYAIDLPKMLVFQASLHRAADPPARMSAGYRGGEDARIWLLSPSEAGLVPGPVDCAINMASMQEMTPASIGRYFSLLRGRSGPRSRFYCVNRREKTLPGGETIEFAKYPWQDNDEVFVDGPCPYYTHRMSLYPSPHGPRVLGLRVPLVNAFDGAVVHRLVRLAPAAEAA